MPLYYVQDSDRPLYVVAADFGQAVRKWQGLIAQENEIPADEAGSPEGVHHLCDGDELLITWDLEKNYESD